MSCILVQFPVIHFFVSVVVNGLVAFQVNMNVYMLGHCICIVML